MERLTRWNGKKYVLPQGHGVWRKIAERLASYENSGLEPEELTRTIHHSIPNLCGSITLSLSEGERCAIVNALMKAAVAEDGEEYRKNLTHDAYNKTMWLIARVCGGELPSRE